MSGEIDQSQVRVPENPNSAYDPADVLTCMTSPFESDKGLTGIVSQPKADQVISGSNSSIETAYRNIEKEI